MRAMSRHIDVAEVKHGKWLNVAEAINGTFVIHPNVLSPKDHFLIGECSICHELCITNKFNYCPNCGAKMDGVINEG